MNILLGVTGGIAAYKMLSLASSLVKNGHNVEVCMTPKAREFVTTTSFEAIIHKEVVLSDDQFLHGAKNQHIRLAKFADIMVIAPASANTVAKLVMGMGDNIVTLTALASTCKKLVFPAMNINMYLNEITQSNINKLDQYDNYEVIQASSGYLACGDTGIGRLAEPSEIYDIIMNRAYPNKDMIGKKVLVNAGPTMESIDPVRFITNHSSGKMGLEIARAFSYRGADVTLISGKSGLKAPFGVKIIEAVSANDMYNAINENIKGKDIVVLSAAVADYTPIEYSESKIKKKDGNLVIELKRTKDILKALGEKKEFVLVGFAMETESLIENAKAKLISKNADMIVANSINKEGAGFGYDTNVASLITRNGCTNLDKLSKYDLAHKIIDKIGEEFYARLR